MSNMYDQGGGTDLRDQFRQDYTSQQNQLQKTKRSRSIWLFAGIGVLVLLLIWAWSSYNTLSNLREDVSGKRANVDTTLQRRNDLIDNLVATTKGYAAHEAQVFKDIAAARSRMLNPQSEEDKAAASDQISSAVGRLLVLQEAYPDLKANEQFGRLQSELAGTENRIAVARQDYNTQVVEYNKQRQRFPKVVIANLLGFEREKEFKADESARQAPKVDFSK